MTKLGRRFVFQKIVQIVREAPSRLAMLLSTRSTIAIILACALSARAELPSAKTLDRYRQVIMANPVEGTALDRLWKTYADSGQSAKLVEQFRNDPSFSGQMVLGHLLLRGGDLEAAESAYRRAATVARSSPLPWRALARLLKQQQRPADAVESLEKAVPLIPAESPQRAEALMEIGEIWAASGDHEKAARAWEQTAQLSPGDRELRRRLADTYIRNGFSEKALPHLEYVIANAPAADRATAYRQLAAVHQSLGDTNAAIRAMESGIALTHPGNWLREELLDQLIRIHQREQRLPELEARWTEHVRENPRDLGGYLQLLQFYERNGDLENQRIWLEKLTALAPRTPEYRTRLATLLIQLDDLPAAAKQLDDLLSEQPGNIDLAFERALLDVRQDAPDTARLRLSALVQRSGNDETVRARAMAFYRRHHLWKAAEEQLSADAASGAPDAVIALAEFLFSQGRDADAERQLHQLANSAAGLVQRAATWERIARVLKTQGRIEAATDAAAKSLAAMPKSAAERRALLLFLGELQSALSQHQEARAAYEEAFQLSGTDAERKEADQRIFEIVKQQGSPSTETRERVGILALPGTDLGTSQQPSPLADYLKRITREAESAGTAAAWLRLAQWHGWRRDANAALDAANRALVVEPGFAAAHELIIQLTATDFNSPTPAQHLSKLADADPSNRSRYRRRMAQLDMHAGRTEEALTTLESVLADDPGNLEALIDLATVQQKLGRWNDALATWLHVYAASPAASRSESLNALLSVYEKLDQPQLAAELLLKDVDGRKESREKQDRFTDLLTVCTNHKLLPWLREEWEKRRKARVEDYFTDQAMSRILKAQGDRKAAFELLSRASFSAPDPAVALPELVREAEDLYRLDDAVEVQSRIVRQIRTHLPDELIRLAQLQERNFAFSDAAATWSRVIARHPRDIAVLMAGAEFYLRDDAPASARKVLRKILAIEAANIRATLSLADLEIEIGNTAEARNLLERALTLTKEEQPGEPLRFPALKTQDGNRLQSAYLATVRNRGGQPKAEAMRDLRNFWSSSDVPGSEDKAIRYNVIRKLAGITARTGDANDRKAWTTRWKARATTTPGEALWALHYAGESDEMLDLLADWMQKAPDNVQYPQAFIWLALLTKENGRLADWFRADERTASERDFVTIALGQYLETGGSLDLATLAQLLPSDSKTRLWQVASLLASRSQFELAAKLGKTAFENGGPHQQTMGFELAHWHLALGQPDRALEILLQTSRIAGDSFESYTYAALRAYFLLLPEEERSAFIATAMEIRPGITPVQREITGALLHGLAGNDEEARRHLSRLVQMGVMVGAVREDSPPATSRPWTFLLSAGLHLQAWKMASLAEHLWEQALADPTLVRLQGDHAQEVAGEMRTRLAGLKIAKRPLREVAAALPDILRTIPRDDWISVGESLESLGAHSHAIRLYRLLWDKEPSNPQPLRNLLNSCRIADDQETMESVLRACVSKQIFPSDSIQRDFTLQLADVLERRLAHAEAARFLEAAIKRAPQDTRLHQRMALLQESMGSYDEAEKCWKRLLSIDPEQGSARSALATLQESFGRYEDAISTLKQAVSTETDPRLPLLLARAGKYEDALNALKQVSDQHLASAAETLAVELIAGGKRKLARAAIQAALQRVAESAAVLQLRLKLVESFDPTVDQPRIVRELRSLARIARGDPDRAGLYHAWLSNKALELGIEAQARAELSKAWAAGRGTATAGAALLKLHLRSGNSHSPRLLSQLLEHPGIGTQLLEEILPLVKSTLPRLAPSVHERLARLNPLEDQRVLDWAQALHAIHQDKAALSILERWGARAWIDEEFAAKAAALKTELGAPDQARQLFDLARMHDLARRNHATLLAHAQFKRTQGYADAARPLLADAYQNPACQDFAPLVLWLETIGKLDQFEREVENFHLSPTQCANARQALFLRHVQTGNDLEAFSVLESLTGEPSRQVLEALEQLARNTGNHDRAAAILRRRMQGDSRPSPDFLRSFARIEFARAEAERDAGREAEALPHLERANELAPDYLPAARKLASYYQQQDKLDKSAEVWDRLVAHSRNPIERGEALQFRAALP